MDKLILNEEGKNMSTRLNVSRERNSELSEIIAKKIMESNDLSKTLIDIMNTCENESERIYFSYRLGQAVGKAMATSTLMSSMIRLLETGSSPDSVKPRNYENN